MLIKNRGTPGGDEKKELGQERRKRMTRTWQYRGLKKEGIGNYFRVVHVINLRM